MGVCVLRTIRFFAGLAFVVVLLGCEGASQKGDVESAAESQPPQGHGILVVAYAPDFADTFAALGRDSLTALSWLQQVCDSAGIPVHVDHYAFGDMISSIGTRMNGDGGNWLYKVNGGMIPESAGSHIVSPDDSVVFFFE